MPYERKAERNFTARGEPVVSAREIRAKIRDKILEQLVVTLAARDCMLAGKDETLEGLLRKLGYRLLPGGGFERI